MDWSSSLRHELSKRASAWSADGNLPCYRSLGTSPTVLFDRSNDGSAHGNFHQASWTAINKTDAWRHRLAKPHSKRSALPPDNGTDALEMDSSNSSDASLMNCFCCPDASERICAELGIDTKDASPIFGFNADVPLQDGTGDATEIDMRIGNTLFEAKLTEKNFTTREKSRVERYRDLRMCFDVSALPTDGDEYVGYQLIRNVLAAQHHGAALIVVIDQRRPDLLNEWWNIHAAISDTPLRLRCGFRTWQQIAAASPKALHDFLHRKYGL